ncbi:pectinesterase-like [Malania oleifera]|uniref:pectinesterase-like n=1 Tax=Malania oleifera TaxID=397392 RepID=UPI0025ADF29A|nr:pectinesterase-like [Malania oleifera]
MAPHTSNGKVNKADQQKLNARRQTRKRIAIISLSSLVLAAVTIAAILGTSHRSDDKPCTDCSTQTHSQLPSSVKAMCSLTLYPNSCFATLNSTASALVQPQDLFRLSVQAAMAELSRASNSKFFSRQPADKLSAATTENCRALLVLAVDHLNSSLAPGDLTVADTVDNLRTWLSAAGTYLETCIDGFEELFPSGAPSHVREFLKNSTELTSNSLAIVTSISEIARSVRLRRRLMNYAEVEPVSEWVRGSDRRLVESTWKVKADAVVAKDGTGNYRSIGKALKAAPTKAKERYVIYVKKGVYYENVRVEKSKWNVMMVGDGMNATVVSGSLNVVDGTPTFSTATFAVFGKGFLARDMGFQNTAGAKKHQAVALLSAGDQSVFHRCRVDAFQDSLYAHSNRQFYRDCLIHGTVDFIFGNSAVVLQNCSIIPKLPLPGQKNTITAQGKFDPNQNTGISIQNSTIYPSVDLTPSTQTYLGRPWKPYSTTVYMRTTMGKLIDPSGWLPWTGNSAPDTIFYSEYQNLGAGADTKQRAKWKGLRSITRKEAKKFTVKSFIKGDKWVSAANVTFQSGL